MFSSWLTFCPIGQWIPIVQPALRTQIVEINFLSVNCIELTFTIYFTIYILYFCVLCAATCTTIYKDASVPGPTIRFCNPWLCYEVSCRSLPMKWGVLQNNLGIAVFMFYLTKYTWQGFSKKNSPVMEGIDKFEWENRSCYSLKFHNNIILVL